MSSEKYTLRERLIEGIKRKKAEVLEERIAAVREIFSMLSNNQVAQVWNSDQVLSIGEKLILEIDSATKYSLDYVVESTPLSLYEQDAAFGTSIIVPASITTVIFMKAVPEIFKEKSYAIFGDSECALARYAEIDYCPKCGQKTKGEFGFLVCTPQICLRGFHWANIRVFVEETYPCKCKH